MTNMDYNDLSILFDDEDVSEKKDTKKEKKRPGWIIPVAIVSVLGLVIGGAAMMGGNEEPEKEVIATETEEPVPEDLTVQLVNLQQVAWADETCSVVNKWGQDKLELKPTGNETNPVKARKIISWDMDRNITRLGDMSNEFTELPQTALSKAKKLESETMPGDNNLKVGNEVDEKINTASRGIASAFEGYSSAIKTLQKNLNGIADYNFNGIRDTISKTNGEIDNLNGQLAQNISQNFNEETFDNLATLQAVSELESCASIMIDPTKLKEDKGEELDMMNKVNRIVSVRRCKSYLDNTSAETEDQEIIKRRSSCEEVVSSIVLDPNDPFTDAQINMLEDQRVVSQGEGESNEGGSSEPSSSSTEGSETNPSSSASSETSSPSESGNPPAAPEIEDQSGDKKQEGDKPKDDNPESEKKKENP